MEQKTKQHKHGVKLRPKKGGITSTSLQVQEANAANRALEAEQNKKARKQQRAERELVSRTKSRKGAAPVVKDPTAGKIRVQVDSKTAMYVRPGTNVQRIIKTYENRNR